MPYLIFKMLRSGTNIAHARFPRRSTVDTLPRPLGPRHFPLAILTTCALLAAVVTAAPKAPPKRQSQQQVQGLVGLTQVQVRIDEVNLDPKLVGVTRQMIEDTLHKRLSQVGIRLVKRLPNSPQLVFRTLVIHDPRVPNAVAYEFRIQIERDVRVVGVDQTLRLPTYMLTATVLEHKDDALNNGPEHMDQLVNNFVKDLRLTRALK